MAPGLHPARAGRLERPARVVEPDVDTRHEVAGDPHVVVLEDEDAAPELLRARAAEDLLDDLLARPVGRVGLAGEDDLDRSLLVPEQPAQPLDVAEEQAGALVGREAAGEPDRQDVRVERCLEGIEDRRRLAVTGELVAQPAPRKDGELQLQALVRLPQLVVETSSRRSQNVPLGPSASRLSRSARTCAARVSPIELPIQVGMWTPFVTPMISPGATPDHVASAGLGVELADRVGDPRQPQREAGHVELAPVALDADPELEHGVSIGTPPVAGRPSPSRSGPATCRTRSAANRSLPAGTGVWIVNTLSARTRSNASSSDDPGATYSLARSARRNAEWPSLRCQTDGVDPERPYRPDPADAEDELLVEPHLPAPDVEDVGDRAVGVAVLRDVRVEEEDRRPADLGAPDGDLEVAAGQLDRDLERLAVRRPGPG